MHFPTKFSPVFSYFIRFKKKKKRGGGERELRDMFSYSKTGFTPFLPLEINFIYDSVLAVELHKLISISATV